MHKHTFMFPRSQPIFAVSVLAVGICLLFAWLNFRHDGTLIGMLFILAAAGSVMFALAQHIITIDIPRRTLCSAYYVLGYTVRSRSFSIPETGSVILTDQKLNQPGNRGISYSLGLKISRSETEDINEDTIIYYTEKNNKTADGIKHLIAIADHFSGDFGFKLHDRTTSDQWKKYK